MKTITLYLLLLAGPGAYAQYNKNYRELGDKAFNNKEYYEASYYYEKAAANMNLIHAAEVPYQGSINLRNNNKIKPADKAYLFYQLAQSHRLYENYIKAKPWYYNILNENLEAQYPESRLWYGVCLRATGEFEEAAKQLTQYLLVHTAGDSLRMLAEKEAANCNFAIEQIKYPVLARTSSLKGFNTDGSNYALIQKDGNYWFTSSRMDKSSEQRINRIYVQLKGSPGSDKMVIEDGHQYKDAEYGTPSLHPSGKYMYLTRWYKKDGSMIHEILMLSKQTNNTWSKPVALNEYINTTGADAIQPSVSADGKRLFYASNKPGGAGGYDIWTAELDSAGLPLNSVNGGNRINTTMDEQAPYYDHAASKLFFSSKGHTGLGGFDLFESYETTGGWSAATNAGVPVNSSKDDLYYFPDEANKRKFYLSSDRESICCLELLEVYDQRYIVKGLVIDCDNKKPVNDVKVSLQDATTRTTERDMIITDSGNYYFAITMNKPYNLIFEKQDYFTKVVPLPVRMDVQQDTLISKELCLQPFTVGKAIVINNILYDFNAAELRPESKEVLDGLATIMKDNPQLKIELGSHTDGIGSDEYNIKLSQSRAESCVAYIISSGISEDRIFARGYGKSKPIAPNTNPDGSDNPEGRQLNRRTEFTVLSTGITAAAK